jgi:hypothetical protein
LEGPFAAAHSSLAAAAYIPVEAAAYTLLPVEEVACTLLEVEAAAYTLPEVEAAYILTQVEMVACKPAQVA